MFNLIVLIVLIVNSNLCRCQVGSKMPYELCAKDMECASKKCIIMNEGVKMCDQLLSGASCRDHTDCKSYRCDFVKKICKGDFYDGDYYYNLYLKEKGKI